MRKKYIMVILFACFFVNITHAAFLSHCFNMGDRFSSSFEFCVNDNFRRVEYDLGNQIYLASCHNWGTEGISYSYENCINQNFRKIEMVIEATSGLMSCYNYDRNRVHFSYTSCINRNFDRLSILLKKSS